MNVDRHDPRKDRLTRDDSRAIDGVLSADDAARTAREQAQDPARARAVAAYREAVGLWADDARRTAAARDAAALAERVLATPPAPPATLGAVRVPWGYAAAALALLGVGVLGAFLYAPSVAMPAGPAVALDLEQGRLAVLRSVEIDTLPLEGR